MERTNLYLKDVNDRPVTYKSLLDEDAWCFKENGNKTKYKTNRHKI